MTWGALGTAPRDGRAAATSHPPRTRLRRSSTTCRRAMARPLFAQINLAALRANLARCAQRAPGTQVLAVVKANAYGHGLMRVLPALADADGLALLELDAARRAARSALHAAHPAARRLLRGRRAAGVRARRLATVVHHAEQVTMLEQAHARAAARGVPQGQHRDEPARLAARRRGRRWSTGYAMRLRRRAPADDAFRARRRGRRTQGAAHGVRAGVQGAALSALARQLGGRRPLRRSRRRHRASRHHALRRDAVSLRHRRDDRRAAGDDAALARSSPCRT